MIFVETEKFINFLVEHKMTPNQFMFCYLKATYDMNSLRKYIKGVKAFKKEEIDDLIEKGYIEDFNDPGRDYVDSYLVTPKFTKEIFVETEQAGEELWATYPSYIKINGSNAPAKSCDKDILIKTYCKRIKNNRKIHEEILSLLKVGIERDLIKMGIEKWVGSEQWVALKELLKDNDGKQHGIEVYQG